MVRSIPEILEKTRPYKEAAEKYGITFYQAHAPFPSSSADEEKSEAIFADIAARGLSVDSLVLNAANLGTGQVSLDVDIDEFMNVYNTNIGWNFMLAREAAKQMKEKKKGAIVFIGSNSSVRVTENRCAYCSSKSAINAMSKSFAVDFGKYGIRSNCVLPGMIKTDRWVKNPDFYKTVPSRYTPLGDVAVGEDVADAAFYFAAHARNTTGAELTVDGGNMIQLYPVIPSSKNFCG